MSEQTSSRNVLVLVRDLMFVSKITATARAAGIELTLLRKAEQLQSQPANRLIVDLALPGAIPAARRWRESAGRPVIAFVAHTDTAAITEARGGGFDRVVTRGRFTEDLPQLLADEI
jgi:hypothetical protein